MNAKLRALLSRIFVRIAPTKDQLLVAASRIAKLIVTVAALWAFTRWKIDMPTDLRSIFEELLAAALGAGLLGLLTHFGIAIKANPRDVVSPTEAAEGRSAKKKRKATRALQERLHEHGLKMQSEAPLPPNSLELPPPDQEVPPLTRIPAKERGDDL